MTHHTGRHSAHAALAFALCASAASAQPLASNIFTTAKWAWSENAGWTNFADAGSPARKQGVQYRFTHFRGFAWNENVGFINLGNGPANKFQYTNAPVSGTLDFGVNIDPSGAGETTGFAWAENAGWINFDTRTLPPSQRARVLSTGQLTGFAWSENLGWINLHNVFICSAEWDGVPGISSADLTSFVNDWLADLADAGTRAKYSGTPGPVGSPDLTNFINNWLASIGAC